MNMYPIIQMKTKVLRYSAASHLYSHQGCRCFYCNKFMPYMTYNDKRKKGYTVDHLFPRSKGFAKGGNSVLACRKCNEDKGDRYPTVDEILRAWDLYARMGREFIATVILP